MPSLSLKIVQDDGAVTRKVKFDSHMTVKEAHKVVKDKVIVPNKGQEYALFLRSADDDMTGVWLEDDRTLDYYLLRDGDSLDYICRMRNLRVRLLDGTLKTLQVDEAKTVGELMMDICARIGIKNYDEYGLCKEEVEETEDGKENKESSGSGFTLRRLKPAKERDVVLEQMSKRLKTDDNVEWLDQHRTIREQGVDFKETLLLKRRLFYSDRNVDSRDPVQLHLLYVQTRDAILQGRHPVTEQQAVQFAGIQCQIQLGDYDEKKHKSGFIEKLEEYLPEQYSNAWNVEKKIVKEYSSHVGSSELEAKFLYIKTARAMPTYGVTFFLVKEKQKDKKKLVPRLLGINAEAILRLDEVTKEILQQWPLTHVKTYHAGKSQTFTLNFGDYSDKEYSVKTQDCHRIRDILEGYIDIIRRRMLAKPSVDPGESMVICQDNIQTGKSHLIEMCGASNPTKLVTESFVGPTKLMGYDQGSQAQSGTMITTVQQIVVTDHLQNQQQALKGEMPLRGDMSQDCIRKLNRMNSNSVKIVGLLTDPTETHVKDAQQIVRTMQEDFPVVDKGVKETADKQAIEDAKKMLLDELQDLNNFMNKLNGSLEPGKVNPSDAKDAAESIADLTTQMYFSLSPKTRIRNDFLRRSRKSFRDGEKTEQTIRRASFIAAATTALHSVDTAAQALNEDYSGPKLDEEQQRKLERALEDKVGKLNAAIALYLMAHSDPDNIDYSAAINSMNAINELMPEISRDGQMLAISKDPAARKELEDEMRALCDATKKVCSMTGDQNHEKMQQASNEYADVAGKLLYKFARGTNADKENEIVQLAKDVGAKVSRLLVTANELTCQASSHPAAGHVDAAGVRVAGAARDLLHSAELTAPAIQEPHCQSALTAAAASLSSSVHQLESSWRPLVEDPTRQHMADLLHTRKNDVLKALDRLKDAYANMEVADDTDHGLPLQEKKRLKFITTLSGAKNKLQGVKFDEWNKPASGAGAPSEPEKAAAQNRLEQKMAQLNAAVAALAAATADRENPDYETAELAISTMTELMPQIAKDMEIVSSDKDEATRAAMQKNLFALCDAAKDMCEGDGYQHVQGEPLENFTAASGKLVFLVSPGADKGKQKHIMDLSSKAQQQASDLVSKAQQVKDHVEPAAAAELEQRANQTQDDAHALLAVAQVTAASIESPRCRDALSSAVAKLQRSADQLARSCQAQQAPQTAQPCAAASQAHRLLGDSLAALAGVCELGQADSAALSPAEQEKQRLQFVQSMSEAKRRLDAAAQQLTKPVAYSTMREEDAAALQQELSESLAILNAAVASLAAATADREHPDYAAAERAVDVVSSLMPRVVQDARKLCASKNDAASSQMIQDIKALCDASKDICDSAGQQQGLAEAAARFAAASRNLVFYATPGADNDKENEVIGLSADACGKASQLLSQVQQLTELIPDASAAAELDSRGARAADAAQALLTVAQTTASTIATPNCQRQLISAAEKLRRRASELTSSCAPHLQQRPEVQQSVLASHQQLDDSLDELVDACKSAQGGSQSTILSPAEKEKRRLKFINSLTGAKNRLYDSEQQLKQPLTKQPLKPEEAAVLEQKLSHRLAQLNAAVAALAAARADAENPDYAAAEKAVKEISELMPLIVQDSRKLSSTKDQPGQVAMMEDLKALCQASRSICENTENSPKVSTEDFNKAASKLVFLVSPAADKTKEKQVLALSDAACQQASQHLSQMQAVSEQLGPGVAAQLSPAGARMQDAADTLNAVAHATAPTISDPRCQQQVISAAQTLRGTASDLTACVGPQLQRQPDLKRQVLGSQRQLADTLDKLLQACQEGGSAGVIGWDVASPQQQQKQHLKFISSVSGAKDRLAAAEQLLEGPMICQMMRPEDGEAMERKLSNSLAQLNAAVAALAAATADRENPDYATADRAVRTITELMPQVVKDSHTLCGTKSGAEQAAMLQDLKALCEASRQICDSAGQPEGLSDAAAKFSAASGKLVYIVSPTADAQQQAHEKQVLALSAASCGKASELLSQAQRLTELIPDASAAAELDSRGARAADAAQALLTVAQTTAPTISDPHCQKEVISAAEKLRSTASDLTSSCAPHLQQRPEMKQQVSNSQRELGDSLDKLVHACKAAQNDTSAGLIGWVDVPPAQQRLKFISSMSEAKEQLDAAEKLLKEPMICQMMRPEDGEAMERKLSNSLAQLNAAVAALAAATADREHSDYASADRAVRTITELMPQAVQDSHTLCGTKSGTEQAAMLQDLKALCEASRQICDSAGQPQGLSDAAAKFSAASGKLVYIVSPTADAQQQAHEKQIRALSATSCDKAGSLQSQAQLLTDSLLDACVVAELEDRSQRLTDAAQALLTVVQTTAPTIADPHCQKEVISAAEKLRRRASELTSSCAPHLQQRPEEQQQVLASQQQLDDSLDKLVQACQSSAKDIGWDVPSAETQKKQRLKFISSVSGAKQQLDAAEKQLKKPMICQMMRPEDGEAMERKLSNSLAQLNAAVAALAAATADREHPDYASADRAVRTITELLPQVVQDSHKLCGTKTDAEQAAMLQDLKALCEASRQICDNAGQPQGLSDAAAKFSAASGKLVYIVSPTADAQQQAHEKQVLALSAASCGKASELLSQAQRLTELIPDASAAAELDSRGARAADAAQALLTVAQATAPTIGDPQCQKEVISAAEKLRHCASELTSSCAPHLQQRPEMKQQILNSQRQLDDNLDKVIQACKAAQRAGDIGWDVPSAETQEKQRLKFISSVSGAKQQLDAAEKQLKKPMICQMMRPEDGEAMERKLSNSLAQLNAAVAALAAATADREHPDYASADRAVRTITELLPQVVQDSHKLCGTKTDAEQAAMLQDLKALCEASRQICDNAGQPQGLSDAAAKFSAASGKLVYIVSPTADAQQQAHEKQVLALSAASCGKASELLSQAQRLTELIPDASAAAELDSRGARAADAAQALLTVAQATAPTIGDPQCQKEVISAAEKLRHCASELTSSCAPHLQQRPEMKQQILNSQRQLDDNLDKVIQACKAAQRAGDIGWDVPSAETQEKQRLKFISSVSGAKQQLDAAEKQLKKPMICQMMRPEDGEAMERKLSNSLAQLNAAVAALAAATADREHPDYASADRAVRTITELLPQVVQDSHKLCGTKTDAEQAAMLQDLKALCEASRQICDNAGQPQGLSDAAAKFSAASGKLVYIVSPTADAQQQAHEKQVLALSAASCGKASELLSQAQRLTELIPDASAAAELDSRGARAADAAQALLTVAQATAPTIGDPQCQKEVISAAEKLRHCASELTSSCAPHLQQRPEMKQQILNSQRQLDDNLDKVIQACKAAQRAGDIGWDVPSAETQEKQRLKFISSVSGAKQQLDAAEKQLKKPMICQMMRPEDGEAMERKLSNSLAQLNAAVAALAAATADREHPDYASADRAVRTITELLPQVVQDSHKLCGTKTDAEQAAMLQDLKALCEASRQICDNAGQPQGLSDAAAKFSAASGKLVYIVSPTADAQQQAHEKQVLALSAASCGKASELLSQAQRLTELIPDASAAAELDSRGARAADAAQALLTVAQATAPTIGDPQCQKEVISAAEKLRHCASELTSSCAPHLQQRPEMKQQILNSQRQLDDNLDKVIQACKAAQRAGDIGWDVPSAETQEKQRLKFISSVSGAKQQLDAAEKQLKKPMICQMMRPEDGEAMERKLSNSLAQLNAAVAALAAATADREHPDYASADRAVRTITELLPQVVQDSHKLCGTKTDAEQAAMLQDLKALCEASRQICDNAGQPQGLSDAAAKFSAASGKLVYIVSPTADAQQQAHEKQVLALSAASCGKASELLSQAQRLTELIPDASAAAELDSRGARAADAAQALLTVAQATAPTIGDPQCQKEVISAAEKLRHCASELTSSCAPHLQQRPEMKQQILNSQRQLDDNLDKVIQACKAAQRAKDIGWDVPSAETQEKQRLKFISSVSGAKQQLDAAEKQLKKPMICQMMRPEDGEAMERKLSNSLAQLNAAVAALAAATADREHPDYASADRAVRTITELMPQVVQDSHKLCGTKTGSEQAAMLQDLKALCEASRQICDNAGQPQGLSDAAAKFSAASGKLVYIVSPTADAQQQAHEKQVLALSAASCGKASELLSQAQRLTELIPDASAAAELDSRGARAADAAQALLTVAQATAPTIGDSHCQKEVISAAEKLRHRASELTSSCAPHLQQRPEMKQQILNSQRQLDDNLDKVIQACKDAQHGNLQVTSPAQQEKQRLKFLSSASEAKNNLQEAQSQLSLPIASQDKPVEPAPLQQRLSDRLAQLNAAVAALTTATADREHPDYATAHQAVESIPKLLREVIHDSRALCANKTGPGAAAVTKDLSALCEATRQLCDSAGQPDGLGDAAAKFSAATGKMMVLAGPKTHTAEEKQVINLSSISCGKASELLSQVQRLTELVADGAAAAELDQRGARAADAAQALLNVVQVTASSISDPTCADQLVSAAEKLRHRASELTSSCAPHLQQRPVVQQSVLASHQQLDDSLDKLIQACKAASQDVVLSPQQEKQRMKFVSSMSGAKKHLDTAEQQMKKPVVPQKLKQADGATLQHQLCRRLAQLNAAVAALAAATQDGKNPDYPAAERAVITITELMPQVVQESHAVCRSQDAAGQAATLQQLRDLCDASRAICHSAGQPTKLNEASAKLANASGKLLYIVSPEGSQGTKPAVPVRKPPPPPPARDPKPPSVAQAVRGSALEDQTKSFLDTLRSEESHAKADKVVDDARNLKAIQEDKKAYKHFVEMIDSAEKGLQTAQDGLKVLHSSKTAAACLPAVEVARREQHMEDSLAKAGVQVAALVAANYADKLDYKAATEPTISLTESVKSVVLDGSAIYSSLPEHARKPFVDDMAGLCQATKSVCDAAKSKEEVKKLNNAAISFADQSIKLLRVVSCNIDPSLEKQVISRAKSIGDTASRLALEASNVASSADSSTPEGKACVEDICSAGASCVDTAGKLVYTAKLIAPTIHHATSQDTLVSSADSLSSSLTKFSKTWAPLASSQQPNVQKLTQEAAHLEDLVEKLRKDIKSGRLGKKKEVEHIVNLDSPLRKMTVQIIETAKSMSEYAEIPAEQKKEYINYAERLEEALRLYDLANARYQRAPHDNNKHNELEIASQDLQVTLLQTRPSRAGQEQNNIVDFRDFLQDLVKEAGELQSTAKKNEGPAGKRTTGDIKLLCSKISEDATRLLNPPDHFGDGVTVMNTADDIMDIDMFGQECDVMVKEINSAIQGMHDQKAKQALRAKALPLTESCHLLRFATNSHIMMTKNLAFDETLRNLDEIKTSVVSPLAKEAVRKSQKEKKSYSHPLGSDCCARRASSALLRARQRAALGDPTPLCKAVTYYAAASAAQPHLHQHSMLGETTENRFMANIISMVDATYDITKACRKGKSGHHSASVDHLDSQAHGLQKELNEMDYKVASRNIKAPLLNSKDINKLLLCKKTPVEGTPKQLEDKLHQLSTKLSSMSGTVVLSVKKPESLARSLHAAADVAVQLSNTARALENTKKPVQCKKIEEASQEMCFATYSLLKTSELVCQDPNHHDSRRKLLDACRLLNDSINKLVRTVNPKGRVNQECGEVHRSLQLQRSLLQASPQPCGALPYAHCVDTLQSQRDVLQKLNSEQAMSREEFLKSLNYVASAVSNSTECAAQAAYLISVSEKNETIGKEGIVDTAKLHKAVGAIEESCVSIIMANHEEQVKEETDILKPQVKDLLHGLNDSVKKTKPGVLHDMLKQCRQDVQHSSKALFAGVKTNATDKEAIISKVMDLMEDVDVACNLVEHPELVPTAAAVSADTQLLVDEVVKSSLALLTNTEELIKQVKSAPEEPELMKWVMFNKRKDVLDAFENMLKNIKSSGQRAKLIEGSTEDSEAEKKSFVQKQFDAASKWLLKPVSKAEVKTNGQQAVRNLIEVANKVTEDLKGSDKDDMKTLVQETEQLLTECSKKYDHEQYSVLMERVRELKKGIERGVVTRVVHDFMDAEAPLADLDLVADHEKDESKRKFLLEKKIAELLAQLSRVTRTARLIADTDRDAAAGVSDQLNSCTQQAELLAPMLVKAAQQRVATPDNKAVIENYKSLLAKYAESLSKIRDLCDQSVDPMDFVQTAGETMERMREESTKHNDPMQCAHTSAAITKLANRVIHVGLASSTAKSDPELQKALSEAQQQLTAASPPADTRASRMPDWKDTTAKILQATEEVESLLCGENVFKTQPGPNQPIYNEALNLHVAIRDWSSRDNEIVAVAKRMAVLMAKLSNFMSNDKQREVLTTSKSIVTESHEVARLAKKLAHECADHRIKTNLLQTCERIPTISGQLKMLTTVKGFSLGRHGTQEDKEALDMLVGNAQSLMLSIQDVVKGAASASVKIMSQRGPRMKWVRKTVY